MRTARDREAATEVEYDSASEESDDESSGASFQDSDDDEDDSKGDTAALTIINKIAIKGTPQMAADKEAISLSRVHSYSK